MPGQRARSAAGDAEPTTMSRRAALRAAGSVAAAAGLGAVAGCGAVGSLLDGGPTVGERPSLESGLAWPQRYVDARNSSYAPGSGPTAGVEVVWSTPAGSATAPLRVGADALYVDGEPSIARVEGDAAADETVTPEPLAPLENSAVGAMALTTDILVASYASGVGGVTTAVDRNTGEILWTDHRGTRPLRTITVANGTLYYPGEEAILAVDPSSGAVERRYELAGGFSSPAIAIADGVLYWFDLDVLSAIDLADGSRRWAHAVEYPTPLYEADDQTLVGPLVVGRDRLFAVKLYYRAHPMLFDVYERAAEDATATSTATVRATAHSTTRGTDRAPAATRPTTNEPPTVATAELYAFDRETGERSWSFAFESNLVYGGPSAADGVLFVTEQVPVRGDGDRRQGRAVVRALDASDGSEHWSRELDPPLQNEPPVVADGAVYLRAGSRVVALDASDGSTLFSRDVGVGRGLAVANGRLYVTVADERLLALGEA